MYPEKGETHRPNAIVCMVVNISPKFLGCNPISIYEITNPYIISIVSRDIIISNKKYYISYLLLI